ncbi:MAG: hypothetical protein K1X77_11205 [Bacteroidia bacterium]|nr:hypothetical protein [Bacteroidia bacterium]
MKINHLTIILFTLLSFECFAQWNGYMYWEMRQRFLDKFIRIGEGHGMSIPGSWIKSQQDGSEILVFEDESTRHIGWYLAMLATEHKLLEHHGYPTDQNEQEMYYAFKAIKRLDGYAEFLWDAIKPKPADAIIWNQSEKKYEKLIDNSSYTDFSNDNMNGFLIREDVPPGFGQLFTPPCGIHHQQNTEGSWIHNEEITGRRKTVMSQDQFFHLMFGMSFVKKYMGNVEYDGMNFVDEAKAFCLRVMDNYDVNFQLRNPVQVEGSNGIVSFSGADHVRDLDGNIIGNSAAFGWFVAVMANWFINDQIYIGDPILSLAQDYVNPFVTDQGRWPTFAFSKAIWSPYFGSAAYPINAIEQSNQIMAHLLICMSNAYSSIFSGTILNFNEEVLNNPGYRFYATAFRLLHNFDQDIGYSKQEMQEMLSAMDCEGP